MNTLIVHAHPDPESFGAALARAYADGFSEVRSWEAPRSGTGEAGSVPLPPAGMREIVLTEERFDPVLRLGYRERMPADEVISRSQEALLWADHIVIITPIWWASFPALLHGWFERVLAPGFAYNLRGIRSVKHLGGKRATLVATSYAPGFYTRLIPNAPARLLRAHILGICGIRLRRSLILGSMGTPRDTAERRARFVARVRAAGQAAGRREP